MSSCDILPCPFSDHSAVVFISSIPNAIPRGPGRWHLNISILDEPGTGLLDNLDSFLTPEQAASCDGPLSVAEVLTALNGISRNKTPGSDGLPVEFYIEFWHVIGSDLTEVFNNAYDSDSLSKSQKLGLITLLFKKGDRLNCKNWRPITLLNVDYKLCARTIAGRLLKVLQFVVAPDQTCGVPGRFIGENVAFLRDVVSYVSGANLSVAILSLDQEKAFD